MSERRGGWGVFCAAIHAGTVRIGACQQVLNAACGVRRVVWLCLIGAVMLGCSDARTDGRVSIVGDPRYAHAKEVVQALVQERGAPGEHHFCIVGHESASGAGTAWVHWQEGNQLILWEPSSPEVGEPYHSQDLLFSRRPLDLATDVVDTLDEQGTSTYLVTRAWVDGVLSACDEIGLKLVVAREES